MAIGGSVIAAVGCLASLAATNIWHIAICYGALTGTMFHVGIPNAKRIDG